MRYKSWSYVPKEEKDELIARVLGDFEIDWERYKDRECIKAKLAYSYNHHNHEIHKIYKTFATLEKARTNPPEEVAQDDWLRMCDKWEDEVYQSLCLKNSIIRSKLEDIHTAGSKSFLNLSVEKVVDELNKLLGSFVFPNADGEDGNLIKFYFRSHTDKDSKFTSTIGKERYMMEALFGERDCSKTSKGVAEQVFHKVLGHHSKYVRGPGKSSIPKPTPSSRSSQITHLTKQVEKYKSELEICREKYENMQATMLEMMAHFDSYGSKVNMLVSQRSTPEKSLGDSQP
ncbi:hypothetical protein CJ030_MR4G023612 [Morella rubra]|uniref:Uncharacterized protein n=1 Tax=Morella rubra TaxID=262757 RepID=A0A6A1VZH1_9ROSI|nr:hypothetical protein CJ030_MR4G023612 [Morella rubra]